MSKSNHKNGVIMAHISRQERAGEAIREERDKVSQKRVMKTKLKYAVFIPLIIFMVFSMFIMGSSDLYAQDENPGEDYKIGAEDVLEVSVWGNEHLNREVIVRPDGKISFPLVNDIKVNGLTAMELREILTQKLSQYVNSPEVTVIVKSINNYKVYVMGAVNSPGVFSLKRKTSLLQLLTMAGGLTLAENADLKRSYVLRAKERLSVDFEKLIEEGDITQNVELLPDDIIYIPDNFSKRITVIGEVTNPGTVTFKNGITALDAVLMSGGPTEDADLNDTKIVRKKAGKEESLRVRLKDVMKKGRLERNIKLEPGDMVIVPASLF